jgi:hypothetical protein
MGGGDERNDGEGELKYDIRISVNATMYPQHNKIK